MQVFLLNMNMQEFARDIFKSKFHAAQQVAQPAPALQNSNTQTLPKVFGGSSKKGGGGRAQALEWHPLTVCHLGAPGEREFVCKEATPI